jgi:adenylyl-sulfate kinase
MGKTIWLTGLSGAGKTTIAKKLKAELENQQFKPVIIVDGDDVRSGLCNDLLFDDDARTENIRRCAEICKILNQQDVITIACLTSPLESQRSMAKKIIGSENFMLVYLSANVEICSNRDVKGLYKKFNNGEVKNMIGLDLVYEKPKNPHLTINSEHGESMIDYHVDEIIKTYHTIENGSLEPKVVRLRFNHDAKDMSERWRVYFVESAEYINASDVVLYCKTKTTEDIVLDNEGYAVSKWHITATYFKMIELDTLKNNNKTYIFL